MHSTVAGLWVVFLVAGLPASATGQDRLERHISVVGEGTVSVAPDLAIIQAGVTTQAKTARAASEDNSAAMDKVLSALKARGIPERDIQTARFSIRPLRDTRRGGDQRITGFEASNQIGVKVRALPKLATVLDEVIAAGANDISGIHFTVSERSRLLDNARAEAVADARRKAELLAKAAGVRLGPAAVVAEDQGRPIGPERMSVRAAPDAAVPIAIGEQTLRVQVSVTFELLPGS